MTLPVSGPLSLSEIQTEFGGSQPILMSEYYKGGPYVNEYSLAPHVPVSGPIKISDFYGASHYIPVSRSVTLADGESFIVPVTIQSPLTVTLVGGAGGRGGNDVGQGYPGYSGYQVSGNITVSAGDLIQASVGGPGVTGGTGTSTGSGAGGYGGVFGYAGGRGGITGSQGWSGGGGGGGGATSIKKNGTIVCVAAGGAGGGGGGWHSNGRPSQGYSSSGSIVGGAGADKNASGTGDDGGGAGGGGGGQLGGGGGDCYPGDEGAYSGSDGANLIPPGGSSVRTSASPSVVIQGTW